MGRKGEKAKESEQEPRGASGWQVPTSHPATNLSIPRHEGADRNAVDELFDENIAGGIERLREEYVFVALEVLPQLFEIQRL